MQNILQINSSLRAGDGESSKLADALVRRLRMVDPDVRVTVRNLAQRPLPHLDAERFGAFLAAPEARTAEQNAVVSESDALIDELRIADTVVIGLPMYNFGVPSQLKAYFDHIARAGVTFRYTEQGPVGLLTGKKVYVLAAFGGPHRDTPRDTETGYVRTFLALLGLTDVEFVYAEGLNLGEAPKQAALRDAHEAIDRIVDAVPDAA